MASDWIGDGSYATGIIYLNGIEDGDSITINGLEYTAKTISVEDWEFVAGKNKAANAERLATVINNDSRIRITVTTQDVTATSIGNVVTIKATVLGKTGNDIDVSSNNDSFIITSPTLSHAQNVDAVHLDAGVIRYAITTDGKETKETPYINKSSLGSAGESVILTNNAVC